MSTEAARADARAIARGQRALLEPTHPPRRAPRHIAYLPLAALYASEGLPAAARALYLHLWMTGRLVTGNKPLPPWFWHTDAQLERETGASPATLLRARRALRAANLINHTTNQGEQRPTPTWYFLRFPLEIPDHIEPHRRPVFADEWEANGHPPTPLRAWAMLVTQAAPAAAEIARDIEQTPPGLAHLRLDLAARIPEVSPWLYRQLIWAAPELYRPRSVPKTQLAFGELDP